MKLCFSLVFILALCGNQISFSQPQELQRPLFTVYESQIPDNLNSTLYWLLEVQYKNKKTCFFRYNPSLKNLPESKDFIDSLKVVLSNAMANQDLTAHLKAVFGIQENGNWDLVLGIVDKIRKIEQRDSLIGNFQVQYIKEPYYLKTDNTVLQRQIVALKTELQQKTSELDSVNKSRMNGGLLSDLFARYRLLLITILAIVLFILAIIFIRPIRSLVLSWLRRDGHEKSVKPSVEKDLIESKDNVKSDVGSTNSNLSSQPPVPEAGHDSERAIQIFEDLVKKLPQAEETLDYYTLYNTIDDLLKKYLPGEGVLDHDTLYKLSFVFRALRVLPGEAQEMARKFLAKIYSDPDRSDADLGTSLRGLAKKFQNNLEKSEIASDKIIDELDSLHHDLKTVSQVGSSLDAWSHWEACILQAKIYEEKYVPYIQKMIGEYEELRKRPSFEHDKRLLEASHGSLSEKIELLLNSGLSFDTLRKLAEDEEGNSDLEKLVRWTQRSKDGEMENYIKSIGLLENFQQHWLDAITRLKNLKRNTEPLGNSDELAKIIDDLERNNPLNAISQFKDRFINELKTTNNLSELREWTRSNLTKQYWLNISEIIIFDSRLSMISNFFDETSALLEAVQIAQVFMHAAVGELKEFLVLHEIVPDHISIGREVFNKEAHDKTKLSKGQSAFFSLLNGTPLFRNKLARLFRNADVDLIVDVEKIGYMLLQSRKWKSSVYVYSHNQIREE